ncbi:MAG: hypothetical protein ACHQ2Y_00140 [Candidatus Lutacidiplasmatales archaeon]
MKRIVSETTTSTAPRARPQRPIWSKIAPALGGAGVAALLLLVPIAQAAPSHPLSTYAPPYNGKGLVSTSLSTLGCGVKGTITTHPKFTTSSGVAKVAVKAAAKSCGSPLGYNWVKIGGGSGYFTRTFTHVSGVHHVVAHWSVAWSSTVSVSKGPKFTGGGYASSFVVAVLWLLDETNLTYLSPANSWGFFSAISNGTVSNISSATVSMYLNQTLVSGHVYSITTAIDISAYAQASSKGPSTASALLSLAGSGKSTKLTSITFT